MPRSRASGCAIWRVRAASARAEAVPRPPPGRALHDGRAAPGRPASLSLSRRAPERPAHAPETAIPWHQSSRGEIELQSKRHRRHSSLFITQARTRVLVDCGEDWLDELDGISPHAILLTHAHRDHAGGLRRGGPCPVYATDETWSRIARYPIETREPVLARTPFAIGGITFEARRICGKRPGASTTARGHSLPQGASRGNPRPVRRLPSKPS